MGWDGDEDGDGDGVCRDRDRDGNGRIVAWWWHAHLQFFYDATSLGSGISSLSSVFVFFFCCFSAAATHTRVPCTLLPGLGLRFHLHPSSSGLGLVYSLWARSAQRDEWLAKMFECDHELDLSHNLKSQSQSLSQVKSSQLDALHTRHVNQAQRHGSEVSTQFRFGSPDHLPSTHLPIFNGHPAGCQLKHN